MSILVSNDRSVKSDQLIDNITYGKGGWVEGEILRKLVPEKVFWVHFLKTRKQDVQPDFTCCLENSVCLLLTQLRLLLVKSGMIVDSVNLKDLQYLKAQKNLFRSTTIVCHLYDNRTVKLRLPGRVPDLETVKQACYSTKCIYSQ